ncbi:MAG TPA: imidazole glycerol phosphate synthase subunit HisH [Acidimicrobiia bacterium]|nr:imidazole glycerol phosphate synthase subunit HisH [Acidimicrobiia bacterium]
MIGVVDYRAGNAPSVGYALERLGIDHRLVDEPGGLDGCDRIILPGVGAACATLESLDSAGFVAPLTDAVRDAALPFLGICIGLQVLFQHSAEGDVDCLGWIPGAVHPFPTDERVPQIGWNSVHLRRTHPVTAGFPDGGHCYFVNSFYAAPTDPGDVLGETAYGVDFCSIVAHENIVATQFHAEKSGALGLSLLEAFATWDGSAA